MRAWSPKSWLLAGLVVGFCGLAGCEPTPVAGSTTPTIGVGSPCQSDAQCGSGRCVSGSCQAATTGGGGTGTGGAGNNGGGGAGCAEVSECGNCDASCRLSAEGGGASPFDLNAQGSDAEGVVLNDDGHITLDSTRIENHYIWIANTGDGTISKVDTRTYQEVGRFWTGPQGGSNDPSRTSVNTYGDVFVGNRQSQSVTKISGGNNCVDRNGDGQINTSTGAGNVLPWGEDECVLWNTPLPGGGWVRAVAAQDTGDKSYVWVGGWDGKIWKLGGETGDVLVDTAAPVNTYGFALDRDGNLWMANLGSQLGRVDTNRCTSTEACNVDVCGDDGDQCIKQRIQGPTQSYGITVDYLGRVWLGGSVSRYDPRAPVGQRWTVAGAPGFVHGIAADERGFVYGAAYDGGVIRLDADTPQNHTIMAGTAGRSVKGVAVDLTGNVWAIHHGHSVAQVLDPGNTLGESRELATVGGLSTPYTYSDMTGSQLRFATNQRGAYRKTYQGCSPESHLYTEWKEIRFDAEVPEGATLKIRVRAALQGANLQDAEWIDVGEVPGVTSPILLDPILAPLNLKYAQHFEVEFQLKSLRVEDRVVVPVLKSFAVEYSCPLIIN